MTILNALLVSLFGISIVFAVLIALSFIVKLQSFIVSAITRKKEEPLPKSELVEEVKLSENTVQITNGELKLINVDDRTAAMIMAIVCDELQSPVSELQFKSIKALD